MKSANQPTLSLGGHTALSLLVAAVFIATAASPAAATGSTYAEWLAAHGLPLDASGSGALMADPAGDTITNLMKFGLGLNPDVSGYDGRFSVGSVSDAGQTYLALTYRRPDPSPVGIAYAVEIGASLADWAAGGQEIANSVIAEVRTITVRDTDAMETDTPRRFMRLKVITTATVPANTTAPLISGTPQVGQTLTVTTGTWTGGTEDPTLTYQWTRNGVDIAGATGSTYVATAADLATTLAVRVTGRNIAGAASVVAAGVGPIIGVATFPSLNVRPDGYTVELSFANLTTGGTYALTPDATPKVLLTVTSPGFDATGAATTVSRQIVGTVPLRQPYPNENSPTEAVVSGGVKVTIALADRIYAGDTVSQCILLSGAYVSSAVASPAATLTAAGGNATNSSGLAYPKAIANWLAFPRERAVSGATAFDLELLAFHRHPRAGRQVACVELIATDEHANSVSVKTAAMVQSTRVTTGNPIAVYRASIPLGSLTQGDFITVRTKVYPFLGDSTGVLDSDPTKDGVDLAAVPSGFSNYTFLNDKTGAYGTVYAYVSPTGSDTTGVASATDATAAANPCLTIYGAAAKLKAANNTLYSHNDLGGGFIRLKAGTYAGFGTNLTALGAGKTWLTIEAAPSESVSTVSIEPGTAKRPGNWVKFKNLALTPNATSHTVLDGALDGSVDGPPVIYGAYEGLRIHGLSVSVPIIFNVGLRHFIGCDMKDLGRSLNGPYSTTREHTPLLAGCTLSYTTQVASGGLGLPTWTNVGNIVSKGFYFSEVQSTAGTAAGTTRVVAPKFGILAFNSEHGAVTTNTFGFKQPVGDGGGLAIVQNVFEFIINAASPCFNLAADSAVRAMDNVVVQHMTVAGARTNFLYNDDGTLALSTNGSKRVDKNGTLLYSVLKQYNCKTDTFDKPGGEGPDGARIGNWEVHHGVGQVGNVYQSAAANSPASPYVNPISWNGMYLGRNVKVAGTAAFVSDLSLSGANTGGGNYRIGASSDARNRVPAGFATLPFDLDGTPRINDGTGAAGAYEYFIAAPAVAKPDATNTGWSGTLTPFSGGNITVTGTLLENLDITGTVYVKANDVIIRNCRLTANSFYAIQCTFGFTGLLIENCELTEASSAMIYGGDFTARRLNIHHGGADGLKTTHDVLVEQCWIHHLGMTPTAHADGVQTHGGGGANFIYRYNNFDLPVGLSGFVSNSAFILEPDLGEPTNVLVDNNWLNGGNYTVYGSGMAGVTVTNNKFGRSYLFGIRSNVLAGNWSGNTWEDDGTPAN